MGNIMPSNYGKACLCCCIITTLSLLAIPLIFFIYLGIFAFANPDAAAWVSKDTAGNKISLYSTQSEAEGAGTEVVDIHGRFVSWFLWGFIQMILPCAWICLSCITGMINEKL